MEMEVVVLLGYTALTNCTVVQRLLINKWRSEHRLLLLLLLLLLLPTQQPLWDAIIFLSSSVPGRPHHPVRTWGL
jgi:Na+-transporting NADH:ubiquinone oxidoreductase subunit NqrB